MKRHLQELVEIYGQQNLVSLVNQKGYEKPIKEAYEKYMAMVSQVVHQLLSYETNKICVSDGPTDCEIRPFRFPS